ncbi:MAG: hypothetical protein ACP5QT_05355 [Brevinematia bacterium]
MEDNYLILKLKDFIERKIRESRRKFEIIYSSTNDSFRKEGLKKIIEEIDRDLKRLNNGNIDFSDLRKYNIRKEDLLDEEESGRMDAGEYKILRNVPVFPLSEYCKNDEINTIWSYLSFFGREYLGFLSSQNLKLDYSHSYQRDKFFGNFNELIKKFEDYNKILEQIEIIREGENKAYRERLISVETKEYRDLIIKTGKFLYDILSFIESIIKSEKDGETVMLEPDRTVKIEGEISNIDGLKAREALFDLYQFTREFLDYLKMPKFE